MPTYDYECSACGHKFEEFQSIKADPIKTCPVCKKNRVKRLIGAGSGLIFKGSGFYCTDYRDGSYKSSASRDKPSSETKSTTETKPAAETKSTTETKSASTDSKTKTK